MSPDTQNPAQGPSGPLPGSLPSATASGESAIYPRVAVVGVIRGGTSLTVGLLRILGWRLPPHHLPSCPPGEARALRIHQNGRAFTADQVATQVNQLDDGLVWKDPAIALYSEKINWDRWRIVRVHRSYDQVADSMDRWAERDDPEPRDVLARRAIEWNDRLDRALPEPACSLEMDDIREDPVDALYDIATAVGCPVPSQRQRDLAQRFVRGESGYRCPLPDSCEIGGPGHGGGRMAAPPR